MNSRKEGDGNGHQELENRTNGLGKQNYSEMRQKAQPK